MTGQSTAATRLLCLLGHPVAHSLSPQIHSAALAEVGVDAAYLAFDVPPHELPSALAGLRAIGFWGANLTVPHKQTVLDLVDDVTDEVRMIGAANTLFWQDGRLVADNTDAAGLEGVLREEIGVSAGDPVLIFGAGGAARAAAAAFGRCGASVHVRARRIDAAAEVDEIARAAGATDGTRGDRPRIVVNATPLGLAGERLPDDLMDLQPDQLALDLIYGTTPFLEAARSNGAAVMDGLSMLVRQAGASFERWTGRPAPLDTMREVGRAGSGRHSR